VVADRFGIDLMSGEFFGSEPFAAYAWMREHAPAYYDESNDPWALTRYDDVKSAGTDPAVFSNAGGIRPKFPPLPMMIDYDAPEHNRRRRLVSAGFARLPDLALAAAGRCPAGPRTSSAGWSPCRSPSPPPGGRPRPDPGCARPSGRPERSARSAR
jgi:hypothetical protein